MVQSLDRRYGLMTILKLLEKGNGEADRKRTASNPSSLFDFIMPSAEAAEKIDTSLDPTPNKQKDFSILGAKPLKML